MGGGLELRQAVRRTLAILTPSRQDIERFLCRRSLPLSPAARWVPPAARSPLSLTLHPRAGGAGGPSFCPSTPGLWAPRWSGVLRLKGKGKHIV